MVKFDTTSHFQFCKKTLINKKVNRKMKEFIPAYIIAYSNSDFTNPHEVVLPDEPKDCRKEFTHAGAKYWGLETNRHKATYLDKEKKKIYYQYQAHHWVKIGFKQRAKISTLKVSTKWFTGNQVRAISVVLIDELVQKEQEVLTRVALQPDEEHTFAFMPTIATECYIKIYYEGGISRINFFGELAEEQLPQRENLLEQATISHVSNDHYGHPKMAVHGNRKEMHMVGWESARTGFGEQAIFHLAEPSSLEEIVVDTYLHRFNAPLTCHIFGLLIEPGKNLSNYLSDLPKWGLQFQDGHKVVPPDFQTYMLHQAYLQEKTNNTHHFEILLDKASNSPWQDLLPYEPLQPDTYHRFTNLTNKGPFSHLLYMHYPNGGIHGLKVF